MSDLWLSSNSESSTLMWQDPYHVAWAPLKSYRWFVSHRPSMGYIRVRIYTSDQEGLIIDSKEVYDVQYLGGRLGLYNFQQRAAIWDNFAVSCRSSERFGISLADLYVHVGTFQELGLDTNFVISLWVRFTESGKLQMIFGSDDDKFQVYTSEEQILTVQIHEVSLTHGTVIELDLWYLIAVQIDIQNNKLNLYCDSEVVSADLPSDFTLNLSAVLRIGNQTSGLTGFMTDVRVVGRLLAEDTLSVLTTPELARYREMGLVALHLSFKDKELQDSQSSVQVNYSTAPQIVSVSISGSLHKMIYKNSDTSRKKRSVSNLTHVKIGRFSQMKRLIKKRKELRTHRTQPLKEEL